MEGELQAIVEDYEEYKKQRMGKSDLWFYSQQSFPKRGEGLPRVCFFQRNAYFPLISGLSVGLSTLLPTDY